MNSIQTSDTPWYKKPENFTSAAFLLILGYIAYNYGAGLLSGSLALLGFLGTTIVTGIIVAFIVTQWRLIGTVWNVLMYNLTNWFYKIDPISIAWTKVESLKKKAEKINQAVVKIKGSFNSIQSQITLNNSQIAEKEEEVKALAKLENKQNLMKLAANEITRLKDWNNELVPLLATMTNMQNGLTKLHDAADYVIQDKTSELTILEKKYNSVKVGWNAIRQAQGIYGKNSEDRKDLERAIGFAGEDMNNKLAEMDRFMEMAAPVFMQVDVNNIMQDNKAQEIIDQLTSGEIDKVIDNLKSSNTPPPVKEAKKLEAASVSTNTLPQSPEAEKVPAKKSSYNVMD